MFCEPIRIGVFVQITPDHRLRLFPLGHPHSFDAAVPAQPCVEPNEVNEIGAE
jgi:hypothetical protein